MKTIKTVVYNFDELSDTAKEEARDWYRSIDTEIAWSRENRESMEAFAGIFPIKVIDWSYGDRSSGVRFRIEDENVEGLKGLRLHRWLMNNVHHKIYQGKYYSTAGDYVDGKYTYKKRHSNVQLESSCPFTGYCMDDTLLDPIHAFLKAPSVAMTLKELLDDCFDAWVKACEAEIEYQNSDEAVDETIRVNEYTFTADGKREG